ncbi:uncharacterized protein DUF4157 [Mucilaginibacter frigoritolerans]|uniref:Uncharacterized protein DUF4157 n=1 Tax=Mucilaginibacter frigoritolerans TaxID=652788 RepID=A0A562U9G8_9SPHI|nr:DUF4157 domain-containing protein [Mucilaginibacter frigoritolerans]TWJ02464.1 uncharacterized protein DUF4157 [Mucilaginibacter frigoritolerans]
MEAKTLSGSISSEAKVKSSSGFFFQPKLTINQPNDIYEQEADHMADKVMRMADPSANQNTFFKPAVNHVQRKCQACEEEDKHVHRKENNTGESGSSTGLDSYVSSLSSSGQSMSATSRQFFEPRFGHDFSNVKIHTDSVAAKSAQSINALAYTTGNNIVFNSGQYAPDSNSGKKLMAHELTHVIQQSNGDKTIRRFGSDEHRRMGDTAVGGNVLVTAYGSFSFGEMIAMAGDYFESLEQIASLAESRIPSDKEQIDYVLWKVNSTRPQPNVSQTAIDAVNERYNRLAARNESHFSTGSSPGNSNRERYIAGHTQAIQDAYMEGFNPLVVRRWTWEAREAFAQHYLTDAFSAGHVRTQRGSIQSYWNGMFPNFTDNMITMISCYMASHINERDAIGNIVTVDYLTGEIAPVVRAMGGSTLTSFSIGDLISKVLHDADNAGLDVVSPRGPAGTATGTPFKWRAVGDDHLFAPAGATASTAQQQTQQMMSEAMRLSHEEGAQARTAGTSSDGATRTRLLNQANFRALSLLPAEDTTSTTNPIYAWRAASLPALPTNIQALITAAFAPGAGVRSGLDALSAPCITSRMGFDMHTGDAFTCFKRKLLGNVWGTILEIAAGTLCPPGQNDFCPTLRNPCP